MNTKRAEQVPDNMRPEAIGQRLSLIREAYGLSKSEMADTLNIGRTPWSRFELGQRAIPYEQAYRLVRRFGVTLDFIILGRTSGLTVEVMDRLRQAGLDK